MAERGILRLDRSLSGFAFIFNCSPIADGLCLGPAIPLTLFVRHRGLGPQNPQRWSKSFSHIKIDGTYMHRLFLWRREGDLNPRTGVTRLLVFEASPFSLLGTSPQIYTLETTTNEDQKPQPETKPKRGGSFCKIPRRSL